MDISTYGLDSERNPVSAKVNILLEHNADPNAACDYGMTPTHHAAMKGNDEALEAFIASIETDIEVSV